MVGTATAFARAIVRRRVESQMDSTIKILRGELGTMNPTTGRVGGLTNAQTVYPQRGQLGIARIHTVTGQGSIAVGEGQIDVRQVIISIPWDATPVPRRDDLVQILTCADDPDMVNRALRVVEVAGGSLFHDARRLSCTMWNPSRRWSGEGS